MATTVTSNNPAIARGTVLECHHDRLVLSLPDSDYQLHLRLEQPLQAAVGQQVSGVIHGQARRVDIVRTGGRFIEPLYGRPRRIQGRVVASDSDNRTIAVHAACPLVCTLTDARQKPDDFSNNTLVGFDLEPGATFTPAD